MAENWHTDKMDYYIPKQLLSQKIQPQKCIIEVIKETTYFAKERRNRRLMNSLSVLDIPFGAIGL